MFKKIKFYLHPNFIERKTILDSIFYIIKKYKKNIKRANLLDVGCGSQPYRSIFNKIGIKYYGIDFKNFSHNYSYHQSNPKYYFNSSYTKDFKLNKFKNNSFEIITAFQVLEHHPQLDVFFNEANRILKSNGFLLISLPFIWELHEEPNDYQRLTHYQIKRYCDKNNLKIVEQIKRGDFYSTISQLTNQYFFQTSNYYQLRVFLYLLFLLPFQYLSLFLDLFSNKQKKIFLGYTFLIQKNMYEKK